MNRQTVLERLAQIQEPDFENDMVRLNMIQELEVSEQLIRFKLVLSAPFLPQLDELIAACRQQLQGPQTVEISTAWQTRQPNLTSRRKIPGVKNLIAIAAGKGGVGKSTLCINLAAALEAEGARVGVLDCDLFGPSLPALVGYHQPIALDDQRRLIPHDLFGMQLLSLGFMAARDESVLLRGPRLQQLLDRLLYQTLWDDLDYLLLDLPPGTGDIQLTLTQTAPLSGAILITTPQDVALRDVGRGIAMFQQHKVPILGLVENMSYYLCPNCDDRHLIFKQGGGRKLSKSYQIPFLGELPLRADIPSGLGDGTPFMVRCGDDPIAADFRRIMGAALSQLNRLNTWWAARESSAVEV